MKMRIVNALYNIIHYIAAMSTIVGLAIIILQLFKRAGWSPVLWTAAMAGFVVVACIIVSSTLDHFFKISEYQLEEYKKKMAR